MPNKQGKKLDKIDLKILDALQSNARISNIELARQVGLSATPCSERVRNLEALVILIPGAPA